MDVEGLSSYLSAPSHKHLPHHMRAIIVVGLLVVSLGYGAFFGFVQSHDVTAEVTGFYWQRSIVQQAYGIQTHQDWDIPAGGVEIGRSWEYHYTQYIPISTGKVTIINQYPVYDWYYTYQIYEWYDVGTVRAQGADKSPQWPNITTDATHRGANYQAAYSVTFHTSQQDYHYTLSEGEWDGLRPGATVAIQMNRLGMVLGYKIRNY